MDTRPLFIESICIENQQIKLLDYHNRRANIARCALYDSPDFLDLGKVIDVSKAKGPIVKCRIVFGEKVESINYESYNVKPINSLQVVVVDDKFKYDHKYLDRNQLGYYFSKRGASDDMIMIRNGYVTDSYYGNLAFLKNQIWYTPESPLLEGTKRAFLIENKQIIEKQIAKEEIGSFESVRVFNAMIDFGQIEIPIDSVFENEL